jgi:hypothetical protein
LQAAVTHLVDLCISISLFLFIRCKERETDLNYLPLKLKSRQKTLITTASLRLAAKLQLQLMSSLPLNDTAAHASVIQALKPAAAGSTPARPVVAVNIHVDSWVGV